jgi:hypothetical protein
MECSAVCRGGDFEGNIPGDSDSPIPGYKNILPAPKNEYFFTDFLGRQEITITFKNPISPADFSGNYMFIDAEIFENGAYTLASLPLTIARVNSIDDPIRLTECCLWSVKSISADYAYVSISLSNFTMQNGKYTGCRMTVVWRMQVRMSFIGEGCTFGQGKNIKQTKL